MMEYVVIGTSHDVQDSPEFESRTRMEIQENRITLVAEEFPFDEQIVSKVCAVAKSMQIPYLQIDLLPHEWAKYGIRLRDEGEV
jgi:hypothetical protein